MNCKSTEPQALASPVAATRSRSSACRTDASVKPVTISPAETLKKPNMEEDAPPAAGRELEDETVGPPSAKRPRLFQQRDDLNPSPSPSYAAPTPHTAAPVTSSVLNTRAILSVLKGGL